MARIASGISSAVLEAHRRVKSESRSLATGRKGYIPAEHLGGVFDLIAAEIAGYREHGLKHGHELRLKGIKTLVLLGDNFQQILDMAYFELMERYRK